MGEVGRDFIATWSGTLCSARCARDSGIPLLLRGSLRFL